MTQTFTLVISKIGLEIELKTGHQISLGRFLRQHPLLYATPSAKTNIGRVPRSKMVNNLTLDTTAYANATPSTKTKRQCQDGQHSHYSKGSSDRNRGEPASQPISNGILMEIRGNYIVISVLLSEIELKSSAEFL